MTAKHTPGPWNVSDSGATVRGKDWGDGVGNLIAQVALQDPAHERAINARLIAAAPELLVALEGLRRELLAHVKLNVRKHYSLMVADAAAGTAIAKARGEG